MPTPDPPDADPAPLWALAAVITLLAILAGVLASHPAGCAVPQFGTGKAP